ncbi:unnamed protein product [Spirodela intermedia]|uniref:Uncharacterized protein n=1 Tax=Spirodela intermedia TaxID=51605 RepID=A0A7I8JH71_SPIIN|nr:unnamed protein product [Spirodela intermedia]CAA6669509.1 unnamed protein product [Spirodela intermedia]
MHRHSTSRLKNLPALLLFPGGEAAAPVSSCRCFSGGLLDVFRWNSGITGAFLNGDVEGARRLFEAMPHRNAVTWNCMISGYARSRRPADAQKLFDQMPERNVVSWTALLTAYAKCGMLKKAREIFDAMPHRNVVCWNAMITAYVDGGKIRDARELFDEMPARNTTSWVVMITGYLHRKVVSEARLLFDQAPVLATSLYNALISGYVELGRIKDAEEVFAKMPNPDVVSWNIMITCHARAGRMGRAKALFDRMPHKDTVSWTSLARGYLQNGSIELARRAFDEMPGRDAVAWNTMIAGYVHAGMLAQALGLFGKMPRRDVVSWNSILQGYTSWNTLISGHRDEQALVLLSSMMREGFKPDQGTYTVAISVCGALVAAGWGRMLHLGVISRGLGRDTLVASSLMTMYSKCGLLTDAVRVFGKMPKRDTIAWNALIGAYAHHGQAAEALRSFDAMLEKKADPDHVTFLCVLSACVHRGLVEEGRRILESMHKDWNLAPRSDHYSCVVDLLGRSGSVREAQKLIERMPDGLKMNSWETLLSSCIVHGNSGVGGLAAEKVLSSEPQDWGVLVLVSNFYAAEGSWRDAARLRQSMKGRQGKKETGCSWIEIKGAMHGFVSRDRSHPRTEEIYRELDSISAQIQR